MIRRTPTAGRRRRHERVLATSKDRIAGGMRAFAKEGFPIVAGREAMKRGQGRTMKSEDDRRRAAVLVLLSAGLFWHEWLPALFVVAFVIWVLLHKRLEGDLGRDLARRWRRVWPPATLVLVPLIATATVAYWVSDRPIIARVGPIALSLLAASIVALGTLRTGHRSGGVVLAAPKEIVEGVSR